MGDVVPLVRDSRVYRLLQRAAHEGVIIRRSHRNPGDLIVSAPSKPSDELLGALRVNKPAIWAMLADPPGELRDGV